MSDKTLQDTVLKTGVLEERLQHVSNKIDEIYEQNRTVMPMLAKLSLSLNNVDIREIEQTQKIHAEKLQEHGDDLELLKEIAKDQKSMIKASKIFWGIMMSFFGAVVLISGAYFAFDKHADRKLDREMKAKEQVAEIEEKKKKLNYTREKYFIRNGVEVYEE